MKPVFLGNADQIIKRDNVLIIKASEAAARLWVYSPTIIRVCVSRNFSNDDSFAVIQTPGEKLIYHESENELVINTGALKLHINKLPLRFKFCNANDEVLSED